MPEPIFIYEVLTYLLTGAIAGLAAGLLGIGGGLLIVPVLSTVFLIFLDITDVVHLAIGTSLATIIITSYASVKAHHQKEAVRWDIVKMMSLGVLAGAFLGGWGSQFVASNYLGMIFGGLELIIAVYMLLNIKPSPQRNLPGLVTNNVVGGTIGAVSSLVGIGGGTLTTPYLVWNNIHIHHAIATSAAISIPVAVAGSIGFIIAGLNAPNLPPYTTGYIYWPAFFGIVLASYFTAPIGARWAHRLPVLTLKRLFAGLLILLAIKMLFFI